MTIKKKRRQMLYPFDKWFNGETHTVTKGKDFTCASRTFTNHLYFQAERHGCRVRVKGQSRTEEKVKKLTIQAYAFKKGKKKNG